MLLPGRSSLAGIWGSLASLTLCIHGFPGAGAATTTTQQQPPEISSADGLLEVTLTVDLVTSLDGTRVAPGYNGGAVGPTFRASPGDTVRITLVNDLPAETAVSRELYDLVADPGADPIEQTQMFNRLTPNGFAGSLSRDGYWGRHYQNLHFHGLGVDPSIENNRIAVDGGGESITYEFDLPADQPPGFSWYHNHFHGTASYSALSGLHGAFIVEGPDDPYREVAADPSAQEVILLLGESLNYEDGEPQNFIPIVFDFSWEAVTNGMINPTFTFRQGETVYFRGVNAGVEPAAKLSIDDHVLVPLSSDSSYPLPEGGTEAESIEIDTGARAEFSVTFDRPGTYSMRRAGWNMGISGPVCAIVFGPDLAGVDTCISFDKETIAATIVVTEEAVEPATAEVSFAVAPYLDELAGQPSDKERTIGLDLTQELPLFQMPWDGTPNPAAAAFGINERLGNPHHNSGDIEAGTCEDWTVVSNPPGVAPHTFHAHSVPFLIKSIDGVEVEEPFWRDTYPVLRNITAKVCFPPRDDVSYLNVHCHMPQHQDIGMVAYFTLTPGSGGDESASSIMGLATALGVIALGWALL